MSRVIVHREDRPVTPAEARALIITGFVLVCAGLLVAASMPTFEDPRMFRLQWLIVLDGVLAAATCLIVTQRSARRTVVLIIGVGLVFLAVAIWQLIPFLAECAPVPNGTPCRPNQLPGFDRSQVGF